MATRTGGAVGLDSDVSFAAFADRWIYVCMAALFFTAVLVGFIPDAANMLDDVRTGARPPLPGFMHFHAVMMGAWISLLLAQSMLMATGNRSIHMKLGIVSVFLIPAVAISMVGASGARLAEFATSAPGVIPEGARNGLLEQMRMVLLFPTLTFWAVLVRREDPETHKRFMFIATIPLLSAAIDRVAWLRQSIPLESPFFQYVTQLAWLAPLLIYDLWRRGRLHKAYVIGIAVNPHSSFSRKLPGARTGGSRRHRESSGFKVRDCERMLRNGNE